MNHDEIIKGTINVKCKHCGSDVMGVFYLPAGKIDIKCLECGSTLTEEVPGVAKRPDDET
jgi:ribosomal protein S27E